MPDDMTPFTVDILTFGPALFEKQSHASTRQMVSKMSEDFHEMLPENDFSDQKMKIAEITEE